MSILTIPLEAESSAGAWPYLIGGGALVILFFALFCMLAFGKGREHS
jgi:hypothetical protein